MFFLMETTSQQCYLQQRTEMTDSDLLCSSISKTENVYRYDSICLLIETHILQIFLIVCRPCKCCV